MDTEIRSYKGASVVSPVLPGIDFEEKWRTGNLRFHSNESDVT